MTFIPCNIMNIKRAILTAILLWVLIFFEVSILMFGLKLQGTIYYAIHFVLLVLLVSISALIYFRKVKGNLTEGLVLGVIYVIVGVILDAIVTVPLFIKDYSFFIQWDLLLGLLEIIIISTIIGLTRK